MTGLRLGIGVRMAFPILLGVAAIGCASVDGDGGDDPPVDEAQAALATPPFQVPFSCGEVWNGAGHTGVLQFAVDFNHVNGRTLGSPIHPSAAGTVIPVNPDPRGYGNFVDIDHGGGWT